MNVQLISFYLFYLCSQLIPAILAGTKDLILTTDLLLLTVNNNNGILTYSLSKNNKTIIEDSQLGIKADKFDLSSDLKAISWEEKNHEGKWTQLWGEQKVIEDNHGEMLVKLKSKKNNYKINVRFRLFDDGLGFRYEIPQQEGIDNFNILDEITQFNFAEDSPSWWIPAYAYRRYEFLYANTLISEISSG